MSVLSYREIVGRTLTHRFGEPPTAQRKFILTLDNTAPTVAEIAAIIGIFHGSPHPEYPFLTMTEAQVTEGSPSPFHAEVTYTYEVLEPDERDPNPLARPDIWQFSVSGTSVPALFYYDDTTRKPLVNSAGDYFENVTTDEAECRATISGNRPVFPLATAISVSGAINSDSYLGAPQFSWKCIGISGKQETEVVNDVEINYWSVSIELSYRQAGYTLQLPDIGFTYLDGSDKRRAYVLNDQDERVDSPTPVPLNTDGTMKSPDSTPDIIERRVNPQVAFNTFFGTPNWY